MYISLLECFTYSSHKTHNYLKHSKNIHETFFARGLCALKRVPSEEVERKKREEKKEEKKKEKEK